MRTRIFRTFSTMLSLLLLVSVPAQASPIKFVDVVNVMGDLQSSGQLQRLRLKAGLQDPSVNTASTTSQTSSSTTTAAIDPQLPDTAPTTDATAPVLTAGTEVAA